MPKLARQQLARQWTAIQEEERQRDAASGKISTTEALEILEIEAGAPEQEIRAAYKRLMNCVIRMWVGRSIFPSN
jgi:DnaJ-domain-containing protein 1